MPKDRDRWRVQVGINYRPVGGSGEQRAEPGAVIDDLPVSEARWMAEQGIVEAVRSRIVEPAENIDDDSGEGV